MFWEGGEQKKMKERIYKDESFDQPYQTFIMDWVTAEESNRITESISSNG